MRKILSIVLSFGLLFQQSGLVYAVGELNLANYLSQARSAIIQPDRFRPPQLRYISYDLKSDDFKLLLDKGDLKQPKEQNGSNDKLLTQELLNYFLIGLSLPNDTFWVNLRPDAADNIIDPLLEKTDIGRIFLESDLQLKKDTASLTSPQTPEGKAYWDKLYKKAGELFGSENITIPTITRPWIVPNEVIVRESEDSAYIYKATLKVMLEEDYLNNQKTEKPKDQKTNYNFSDPRLKDLNEYSTQLLREKIIPRLTKEVNSSKRYAKLRQVYYSLILSRWFKQKYGGLGSIRAPERQGTRASEYISLIDSGNLANLNSREPCDKQTYFQAYQKSFKDGEYHLKETVASPYGQSIRSYVSGGINTKMQLNIVHGVNPKVTDALSGADVSSGSPIYNSDRDGIQRELTKIYYSIDKNKLKRQLSSDNKEERIRAMEEVLGAAAKIISLVVSAKNTKFLEYIEGAIEIFNLLPDVLAPATIAFKEVLDKYSTEGLKQNFSGIPQKTIDMLLKFQDDKLKSPWAHRIESIINSAFKIEPFDADGNQSQLLRTLRGNIYDLHTKYATLQWLRNVQSQLKSIQGYKISHVVKAVIRGFDNMEEDITSEINKDKDVKISGSPIEAPLEAPHKTGKLVFWPGDRTPGEQAKGEILTYVRGDELKDEQLQAIALKLEEYIRVNDFWESKESSLDSLIDKIKNGDKSLLSNLRFALSGENGFQGCIEIFNERSKYPRTGVSLVIGRTQWIEIAMTVAGIQELSADMQDIDYPIVLDNILMDNPYVIMVLSQFRENELPIYPGQRMVSRFGETGSRLIVNEFYKNVRERIDDSARYLELINNASGSPLILKAEDLVKLKDIIREMRVGLPLGYPGLSGGKENLKEAVSRIYEYYLEKTVNEFKESAVSKDTELKVKQWQKNKEDLERILAEVTVDKLKNKIINAIGKDVKDLAFDSELPKVKSLDGLMSFLKKYSAELMNKIMYREENKIKLESELSALEKQSENEDKIGFEQEEKIREINNKISSNSYYPDKLSAANKVALKLKEEISQIRELTGVSSSVLAPGGIDFTDRAMFLKIERVGSFADLKLVLPRVKNAQALDLDKEFRQIEAIGSSGVVPNSRRILELFSACYARGEFGRRLPQIVSSLKSSSAIQESLAIDSDDDFRLAILMPEMLSGDEDIF